MSAVGSDDVVATWAQAADAERPPLLVLETLASFLDSAGLGTGPVSATSIGSGHSNVTYLVKREGREVVVRRPPRPPFHRSAHDVLREARIQRALEAVGVRVPSVLAICDNESVVGAPFYVMEHLQGSVLEAELPSGLDAPAARRRVGEELVDALVELHQVDPEGAGLDARRRPTGYLRRQLRHFSEMRDANRSRPLPALHAVERWLDRNFPENEALAVVHGDYRLGNVMFGKADPARLEAILDWEMATLGDPLADVGYLTAMWAEPGDPETPMLALSRVTRGGAFLGRADLLERYSLRAQIDVRSIRWYQVLALWKSAIFLECSYQRWLQGTTNDPYFATLGKGVPRLVEAAEHHAFSSSADF